MPNLFNANKDEPFPKTDLNKNISKLKSEPRMKVQYALMKKEKRDEEIIDELNDSNVDYGVYMNEDFKNVLKALNEYEQSRKENLFIMGDLKYENNAFLAQFKKIQHLNPKGIVGNSQSKIDATFNDLIRKYKARGYEIPDFSVKNNLFEVDPLLLAEMRLHEFYNHQPKEVLDDDKNMKYLENVNADVSKKMNQNYKTADPIIEFSELIKNNEINDFAETQKEIRATLRHNNLVKSYFDFKNSKAIKNLMMESQTETKETLTKQTSNSKLNSTSKNNGNKNFTSEKSNAKIKSFSVLPNIHQKNARKTSTNNYSTLNSTRAGTNNNYFTGQQNSTNFLENGATETSRNKNALFNNSNNNYNKFVGSNNTISNGDKKNDTIENNDSMDKTNIMIKDMQNHFRDENWEKNSNFMSPQEIIGDQTSSNLRKQNTLKYTDKSSILNNKNFQKNNITNNSSFLRNTINHDNFYNTNFSPSPEHPNSSFYKNLKISPNNLKYFNYIGKSSNPNNLGFLTKTNFKNKKKNTNFYDKDKSSFMINNSSLLGLNVYGDQSINLMDQNLLTNLNSNGSKKNSKTNLNKVNILETTQNNINIQENQITNTNSNSNRNNNNISNTNTLTNLNLLNSPIRMNVNNISNSQVTNQTNIKNLNKGTSLIGFGNKPRDLRNNQKAIANKNDLLNNNGLTYNSPNLMQSYHKDQNGITKEEKDLLNKIGAVNPYRDYNNEKNKFLETIYEKLNDKNTSNLKDQTSDYCQKYLNYSNKDIDDLVAKVSGYDINGRYKDLQEDLMLKTDSRIKLNLKALTKIRQLDKNVGKLDLEFLRNINKLNDG